MPDPTPGTFDPQHYVGETVAYQPPDDSPRCPDCGGLLSFHLLGVCNETITITEHDHPHEPGRDGQVRVADSAAADGWRWEDPPEQFETFLDAALRDPAMLVKFRIGERDPLLDEVSTISRGHTTDGLPATILHTEPVTGCAWCIDPERAARLDDVLDVIRPPDPEDFEIPPMRAARTLRAYLDLERDQP